MKEAEQEVSPVRAESNFQVELTLTLTGAWDDFPNSRVAYEPTRVTATGITYTQAFDGVIKKLSNAVLNSDKAHREML